MGDFDAQLPSLANRRQARRSGLCPLAQLRDRRCAGERAHRAVVAIRAGSGGDRRAARRLRHRSRGPLSVVFFENKDASADVVVRPDGKISLPLLNDVQASGLTPEQLRGRVGDQAKRFFQDARRSSLVRSSAGRCHHRRGGKAGTYPLLGTTSVLQLIATAAAQGLRDSKIVILRNQGGCRETFGFNHKDVVGQKNVEQNIDLRPGDTGWCPKAMTMSTVARRAGVVEHRIVVADGGRRRVERHPPGGRNTQASSPLLMKGIPGCRARTAISGPLVFIPAGRARRQLAARTVPSWSISCGGLAASTSRTLATCRRCWQLRQMVWKPAFRRCISRPRPIRLHSALTNRAAWCSRGSPGRQARARDSRLEPPPTRADCLEQCSARTAAHSSATTSVRSSAIWPTCIGTPGTIGELMKVGGGNPAAT